MIYTLTLNPSLDYTVWTREFLVGRINRTECEKLYPGGKGINVSAVLKTLGYSSINLGFIAGFTGDEIKRLTEEFGCKCDFIRVENGVSRINVKLKAQEETEINGRGPEITSYDVKLLSEQLENLSTGDFLVLAGSIPASLPQDFYMQILKMLDGKGVKTIVDASGSSLVTALKYRPFLIKPNVHELGDALGRCLGSNSEIISAAKELQALGAQNILVSMAGDGAIFIDADGNVTCSAAPRGQVVNSVGAGDSMVAGFIAGFLESGDYSHAFKLGLAAGSASAFNEWLAPKEDILMLLKQVTKECPLNEKV